MELSLSRVSTRSLALAAAATAAALLVAPANLIGQAPARLSPAVTFTKDIAPILQRSCQNCHRPGSVAPMSLISYEEVRPWAKSIRHRTALGSKPDAMPPWYIEKNIGIQKFKEDTSLSADEVRKIAAWVEAGAPRGDAANMPAPVKFAGASEWQLGQPDLIVSSPTVAMPAQSPDWWGDVGQSATGLSEDRYVQSVEIKEVTEAAEQPASGDTTGTRRTVGGQAIIHHLAYGLFDKDGKPFSDGGAIWPVHEVGRNPDVFDPEVGKLLPAGSKIGFFSAHLHANGRATKAHVNIGFRFFPKGYKPTKKFVDVHVSTGWIDLEGNKANQKTEGFTVLQENMKIMIFEPHLHAAGVRQCVDAIWGNHTAETLVCAGYNHGWIRVYNFEDDAQPLLPKGTILRMTSYFDTTAANKNIPDPRNWSGLGNRSIDNMSTTVVTGIPLTDEQFEQEMDKRRTRLQLRAGQTVIGCPLCGIVKKPQTTARLGQ